MTRSTASVFPKRRGEGAFVPRPCTVCSHRNRDGIDKALLDGASTRAVASRYRVTSSSVDRRRREPLGLAMAAAAQRKAELDAHHGGNQLAWPPGSGPRATREGEGRRQGLPAVSTRWTGCRRPPSCWPILGRAPRGRPLQSACGGSRTGSASIEAPARSASGALLRRASSPCRPR